MASIDTLNAMIDANIKENGEGAITGNILNNVLKGVASGIGEEVDTRAKVVSDSGINYAEIEGIATNDFYYSMPDSANGNQDDIIATENYLKTINGQSIFGKGNIVIEGGGESYDDTEIKRQLTELSEEKEDKANKTTTLSSASTDTQYPSARATFMAISKKSEVSLEALANGNLKVTIDGVSKDFMAATPSGDPQHYAFMAIGAKYNATANDSSVAAPWAALADDAADKVVIHKAGHWLLNGVGDLTNRDMRHILARGAASPGVVYSMANAVSDYYNKDNNPGANAVRTNCCFASTTNFTVELGAFFNNQVIEVVELSARPNGAQGNILTKTMYFARLATNLRHIVGICIPNDTNADAFTGSPLIKTIDVRDLKYNINFKDQLLLTNASILNMINKEKATNAIVITLHADAYARAMANTNIQSALAAHPNVSLAKA
jgi:hypothetical protein